jgi:hypothetical protein
MPTPIPVGSHVPAAVKTHQLDNPPSNRVISSVGTPAGSFGQGPFQSLPAIDLINIKEALAARMTALSADSEANPEHVISTKRMLAIITAKLVPKSPSAEGGPLIASIPTASGVRPIPPVPPPAGG